MERAGSQQAKVALQYVLGLLPRLKVGWRRDFFFLKRLSRSSAQPGIAGIERRDQHSWTVETQEVYLAFRRGKFREDTLEGAYLELEWGRWMMNLSSQVAESGSERAVVR